MSAPAVKEPGCGPLPLADHHCQNGAPRLGAAEIAAHLATLPGWTMEGQRIEKHFVFSAYHQTIAFVNAVAWIAERENHHPVLSVHYDQCAVAYATHSADGVTLNDMICAAKIERVVA